jgi:hypothetical protein
MAEDVPSGSCLLGVLSSLSQTQPSSRERAVSLWLPVIGSDESRDYSTGTNVRCFNGLRTGELSID